MHEAMPNARPGAIGERSAFDLVSGSRRAPEKIGRETSGGVGQLLTHRGIDRD
jgi:hypothetical protein